MLAALGLSQASGADQALQLTVTSVPANGAVTLKARGFCLDFGKTFPTGSMSPLGAGKSNLVGALNYAVQKGYTESNAQQVQLAVWYLRDNTWHNADHVIAQEIVSNASSTPATASGLSLTDAITQKSVTVSAKFVPQTADTFYRDGDVVITNTTSAAINVYMPIGVSFEVPNSGGQFQNLLAYQLVQATTTPTVGATSTALATATTEPTTQPTATVEVATPQATATTAAVATEAPTVGVVATATVSSSNSTLPNTGDGGLGMVALVALMTAVAMSGLGMIAKARSRV